jgi:hypothetical protein
MHWPELGYLVEGRDLGEVSLYLCSGTSEVGLIRSDPFEEGKKQGEETCRGTEH